MTKYDLNLRDYWRVIRKRKFIVIFTLLAMVVFSFVSAIVTRPIPLYKTNATIKFEKVAIVPGLYDQSVVSGGNLETEAAVIKSYYIQELVAKRLNLIPKDASQEMVRNNSKYINIILDLKDKIQTELDGLSNMINIVVTSTDPKLAQNIANTVAQVYREEHAANLNKRTTESRKFIESPTYRLPWSSAAMSSQSLFRAFSTGTVATSSPVNRNANSVAGVPESQCVQKMSGYLRLLTIPDASLTTFGSRRPIGIHSFGFALRVGGSAAGRAVAASATTRTAP